MQQYEAEIAPLKRRLFAGAVTSGTDVLELGMGTGPNLRYYGSKVTIAPLCASPRIGYDMHGANCMSRTCILYTPAEHVTCPLQDVQVTGIDVNTAMAQYAQQAAQDAGLPADKLRLVTGDVQALPFPDQSFDTVVCTLVSLVQLGTSMVLMTTRAFHL